MKRRWRGTLSITCFIVGAGLTFGSVARADVPAGYAGRPFDPTVAGGKGVIPADVKAGPYSVPGRIDFENYDMGPQGVAYSQNHHETKNGAGYRSDVPTATFSLTAQSKADVWFDSGTAMDGIPYPSATTQDFYIGALDANDWFNYTVNVQTAGTYSLSSTWASGNGPAGGEGGDGSVGLQVFVNGTMQVDWKTAFPQYQTKATYHSWKPYPSFATLTLDAGLQVLRFQCSANHLNLDYVELALVGGADAGAPGDASGAAGMAGAAGTTGASGTTGSSGTSGATGAAGSSGGTTASTGAAGTGAAGSDVAGGAGVSGGAGVTGAAGTTTTGGAKNGGGCAYAVTADGSPIGAWLVLAAMLVLSARTRSLIRRACGSSASQLRGEAQRVTPL